MRTRKLQHALGMAVVILVGVVQVHAQTRGPSTPEERAKVVELARFLERDPLAENAPSTRQWLRQWIFEVPDIQFLACTDLLGHGLGGYMYSREVTLQTMFSGAAFTIEHQDKAREDIAVYNAGVEGALRAYAALLNSKPDARSAFLDDLVAKRDRGELFDYVGALATTRCTRANTNLIAAAIGTGVGLVLALLVAWWFGGRGGAAGNVSSWRPTIAQRIVLVCVASYLIIGVALHVLEPEYDPRFRFMSEYVWGAYGWLMTATFFVLGLAAFTAAAGLREVHHASRSARFGFGLLVIGALFVCLAGVFKEFRFHLAASAVAIPSVTMAVLVLSWSFRHAAGWRTIYPATFVIALGMLAAFLSILSGIGMPGLQQRAFLCLFLLWLSLVVRRLVQVREYGAPV